MKSLKVPGAWLVALAVLSAIAVCFGWGNDIHGVISQRDFDKINIGESRSAVRGVLGAPRYHGAGSLSGEDCDGYEANPGLVGANFLSVCYRDDRVIEKLGELPGNFEPWPR